MPPYARTRIASFPAEAIAHAKAAVIAAEPDPVPGLLEEAHRFNQTLTLDETRGRMEGFLAAGGQTREFELQPSFEPSGSSPRSEASRIGPALRSSLIGTPE